MNGKGFVVAMVAVSGLTACGAASSTARSSASTPEPGEITPTLDTPLPDVSTPFPTPNPATPIGQAVLTTTGAHITVEKTAPASSSNMFETSPPGGSFLGAEVKMCAGTDTLLVEPPNWSVKLADATQIDASLGVEMQPGPSLEASNLNPGSCTDGWVYFPLPPDAQPKEIHLLRADFYWTL